MDKRNATSQEPRRLQHEQQQHSVGILVLNDQDGSIMNVDFDVVGTLRAQDHGHPPLVFDARGNGGGAISPTITGDHQDRITDYTAIVVRNEVVQPSEQN